jgi:hypothetical protein
MILPPTTCIINGGVQCKFVVSFSKHVWCSGTVTRFEFPPLLMHKRCAPLLTMTDRLLEILSGLPENPSLVIELYEEVFKSSFFTFVRKGTEERWNTIEFLTYDTKDHVRELPLFTQEQFVLLDQPADSHLVEIGGQELWEKLLTIIETGRCEVAIDPIQTHGIRLTKEMIQGMLSKYGATST